MNVEQAIRSLALLQEASSRENGVAEMVRRDGIISWRCRYCHGDILATRQEHTETCPYTTALAWRRTLIAEIEQEKEQ